MTPENIAPCGMNCALCISFQRTATKREKHCDGCQNPSVAACTRCTIRRCPKRAETASGFCYDCPTFPCRRLQQLDERYRKNYGMSMIENLGHIRQSGLKAFLKKEEQRWACPVCGAPICVHRGHCLQHPKATPPQLER